MQSKRTLATMRIHWWVVSLEGMARSGLARVYQTAPDLGS